MVQKRPDLWPTPTKSAERPCEGNGGDDLVTAANRGRFPTPRSEDSECAGAHRCVPDTLTSYARLFPTPTVHDAYNCGGPSQFRRNTKPLNAEVGGGLNPRWVEWLMGWPPEWTNAKCSLLDAVPETWDHEPIGTPRLAAKSMPAGERRARLSIIGNGWVPQVAMIVLARLYVADGLREEL